VAHAVHHVVLIPGFFGFVNFGRLMYFAHVREVLASELERRGVQAVMHRVRMPPTASMDVRSAALQSYLADAIPDDGTPLHLIGHSTGGVDARLLLSLEASPYAERVQSAVTVASPHRGTPLATFFDSILGQQLLRVLSLATVTVLRDGRLPMSVIARTVAALARAGLPRGRLEAVFDHLEAELVGRLPEQEQESVTKFFHEVGQDQGLLPQLTPAAMRGLNASASDRPSVRYGCVVAMSPRPSVRRRIRLGAKVGDHATYALYSFLHQRTRDDDAAPFDATSAQLDILRRGLGGLPSAGDSDGIVPVWSQVHGHVVAAVRGDHLDVVGHFDDERHEPPHHDWLTTGSGFNRAAFENVWSSVASFLVG
jgi:hypothetical protein